MFEYSKIRPFSGYLEKIYLVKERNVSRYPQIKENGNFFELLAFFEEHLEELNKDDRDLVKTIRKNYGGRIPDIIELYNKISNFLIEVNNYLIKKIEN